MPAESAVAVLGWLARARVIASRGLASDGADFLAVNRAPEQAQRIFKTAVGAATSADLGADGIGIGIWATDSLRTKSVFYRLLDDNAFTRVPLFTQIAFATSTATGATVAEGAPIPVSKIVVDKLILQPANAVALCVFTDELLKNVTPAGQSFFNKELATAVSDAVDAKFLSLVASGATSTASAGVSASNAWHDLRTALLSLSTSGASKLYWVASVDVAKKASTLADTAGGAAFAAMSPSGGELCNLPALVASGVPAGSLYLIDAS